MIDLGSVRAVPFIAMPGTGAALLSLKEGPITEVDWVTNSALKFTTA
jgi:hypothetical protein